MLSKVSALFALVFLPLSGQLAAAQCDLPSLDSALLKPANALRVATFNAFLNRRSLGELQDDLASANDQLEPEGADHQIRAVAEIIQRVRPDILLLNEFDYDDGGLGLQRLQQNFLEQSQNQQSPIYYPYTFQAASNTGIPSGRDLDGDGETGKPGDAFGFGLFPGQYGMALLSRYPIDKNRVRTFRNLLWKEMPGALLPDNPDTELAGDFYSPQALAVFRLSSKSHWDIPVLIGTQVISVLAAHPTPPVFDGIEDRNGTRNHDEIRLWADYITGGDAASYIVDDQGRRGGLGPRPFLVVGDYNADPIDGDSRAPAIKQLLEHPAINAQVVPASSGAREDSEVEGSANSSHLGHAGFDTADLNPNGPGNLRIDYVLPSTRGLQVLCGGVFWPESGDTTRYLVGDGFPVVSSDHRLVWLDVVLQSDAGN